MAGNIGADAVQESAKIVETCIKQGADVDTSLATLEQALGVLIESLVSMVVLQKPGGEDVALPTSEDLLPMLDRLEMLLKESDAEAGDLAAQIDSQLKDGECRHIQPIIDRIDNFEFEEALDLLDQLRASPGARDSDLG